ncbi:hypothetical protein SK128_017839 [Halocaridina rubra]|uniref:Uncharacterized protein n=1 Tax=Halocaridina rubra TaxID=373956 RepID=A0AAN8XR83_HALRR
MVAFLGWTCFGSCNRYPECMPLLTSDRDGARTLDLTPQSRRRYRLSHGDYKGYLIILNLTKVSNCKE